MIKYKTGDLFDAPRGSYLVHAVNCVGTWGSGVAAQFKERFPESYLQYREFCKQAIPGKAFCCLEENGYQVLCLFTSRNYGEYVDDPRDILEATKEALRGLPQGFPIHMPMINSERFNVPWKKTEELLNLYPKLDITVWKLEK